MDDARRPGQRLGPLAGVPVALKDVLTTEGVPTTCGSKILEGWRPAVRRHRRPPAARGRDVVLLGKTNMDEFAMGSSTENSAYGPTRNPWDLDRVPGGSRAAGRRRRSPAVWHRSAIGTDTGGSIRQPAALTGTVGVKPTYGGGVEVRAGGVLLFPGPGRARVRAPSWTPRCCTRRSPGTTRCDSIDASVPPVAAAARAGAAGDGLRGFRVGVVAQFAGEGYQAGVLTRFTEAVQLLEQLGAEVVEVSCPSFDYALPAYYLIAPSECSSNLARFDAMRYGLRVGDDGTP